MKLKASGVNKAHSVVCINSPDKPCPEIEFDHDDFYDGVVLSMDEADQIIEMLLKLEDLVDDDYAEKIVFKYRHALCERYNAASRED